MGFSPLFSLLVAAILTLGAAINADSLTDKSNPPIVVGGRVVAHGIVGRDGNTYVPLRVVSEALGAKVDYRTDNSISVTRSAGDNTKQTASNQTMILDKNILSGLTGIAVYVDPVRADEEADGLKSSAIQKFVEDRLKNEKIPVITKPEAFLLPGQPLLSITINGVKNDNDTMYGYSIRVALNENVYLERRPLVRTAADIWSKGVTGTVGTSKLTTVNNSLGALVDQFIQDYHDTHIAP